MGVGIRRRGKGINTNPDTDEGMKKMENPLSRKITS